MLEHTDAGDRWIPEEDYQFICERVPILCVDLLPVIGGSGQFGLIERDTPTGRRGLNLVGGGVLLDEALDEALARHVRATLGDAVRLDPATVSLVGLYQYFKAPRPGELHDPWKNAVSATYTGVITGDVRPAGEAYAFHRFDVNTPPPLADFGFGQGSVVYEGLASLRRAGHPAAAAVTAQR
jgi:ADP-ribose pyrophosphatase YjhB (NUDIX family)